MRSLDTLKIQREDSRLLKRAAFYAILFEFACFTIFGIQEHWLAHPQVTTGLDSSKFIETQIYQIPKEAHLISEKKMAAPAAHEMTLSKSSAVSKKAVEAPPKPEEENQAETGPSMVANHGPIAIVAPPPVIPSYLRDQDLSSSVVIEFLVNNQGVATPRLVSSSGNDELDALALRTVKTWQFRPAEQNHQPVDAKVRLKINFQVH